MVAGRTKECEVSRIKAAVEAFAAADAERNAAKVEFIERFASHKVGDTIKGHRYGIKHRIPCEFVVRDRHLSVEDEGICIIYRGFVFVGKAKGSKAVRFEERFDFEGNSK
jgi:hypothetical protein